MGAWCAGGCVVWVRGVGTWYGCGVGGGGRLCVCDCVCIGGGGVTSKTLLFTCAARGSAYCWPGSLASKQVKYHLRHKAGTHSKHLERAIIREACPLQPHAGSCYCHCNPLCACLELREGQLCGLRPRI